MTASNPAQQPTSISAAQKSSTQQRISFVLSLFAFLFSTISIYFNTIRQADDARVIINSAPGIFYNRDSKTVDVDPTMTFTLMNLGNRPFAITNTFIRIREISSSDPDPPCLGPGKAISFYNLELEPLVVDAGKVAVAHVTKKGGSRSYSLLEPDVDGVQVKACIGFNVLTGKRPPEQGTVSGRVALRTDGNISNDREMDVDAAPSVLYSSTEDIFGLKASLTRLLRAEDD